MQGLVPEIVKRFLILWFPFFMIATAFGQEPENKEVTPPEEPPAPPAAAAAAPVNPVQNAVLEGIQISSEPGKEAGENVVTCYFIFRDKPSSYFYEKKPKINKLVFEFNDTQKGTSPIPSTKQPPIDGFEIEQKKIDINKEVKGLNPEYHDMISVTFNLTAMPIISVTDEYNVISFTFKWNPNNVKKYISTEEKPNGAVIGTSIGGGVLLLGVVGYFLWKRFNPPPQQGEEILDTTDLPSHKL
ncbi:MAG TPA: hypothetical protein VLX68_07090 [Chitinivibrionales bacterium]|nr:hypothetical protein [Chitinivibrionales bacterium]